jgi:hypothetical protein
MPQARTQNVASEPAHSPIILVGGSAMRKGTGPQVVPGEPMSSALAAWQVPKLPNALNAPNSPHSESRTPDIGVFENVRFSLNLPRRRV